MSTRQKRDGVYVWVTWLPGLMVGSQSCEWASWFKANYQYFEQAPSDFDSVAWNMNHTRLLRSLRQERVQAGEQVSYENQNRFTYRAPSGVVIGGIPDLVGLRPGGQGGTVYDAKTGRERDSDRVQVMIYMYLLPLANPNLRGVPLDGEVVYQNARFRIPASAINAEFIEGFNHWLGILASQEPATKVPSQMECRFCNIAKSECPERIESETPASQSETDNNAPLP